MIINGSAQSKADDRIVLLWENPDTTVSFDPQTITLDTNNHPVFLITCKLTTELDEYMTVPILNTTDVTGQYIRIGVSVKHASRKVEVVEEGLKFAYALSTTNSNVSTDNSCNIPYRIYGLY